MGTSDVLKCSYTTTMHCALYKTVQIAVLGFLNGGGGHNFKWSHIPGALQLINVIITTDTDIGLIPD